MVVGAADRPLGIAVTTQIRGDDVVVVPECFSYPVPVATVVSAAMDDIANITNQVATGTNQTINSTEELKNLAEQLTAVVEKFRTAQI